jgi:hypothetical protein
MNKNDDTFYIIDMNNNLDFTDKANGLLISLLSGISPNQLTEDEVVLLKKRFGQNILNQFNN